MRLSSSSSVLPFKYSQTISPERRHSGTDRPENNGKSCLLFTRFASEKKSPGPEANANSFYRVIAQRYRREYRFPVSFNLSLLFSSVPFFLLLRYIFRNRKVAGNSQSMLSPLIPHSVLFNFTDVARGRGQTRRRRDAIMCSHSVWRTTKEENRIIYGHGHSDTIARLPIANSLINFNLSPMFGEWGTDYCRVFDINIIYAHRCGDWWTIGR